MFDYKDLVEITAYAQRHNIKTHLDGARLFIASAYSGISPAEYSSHFDTVYISLYKYFNAAAGAILAGSRTVLENMFHIRRMFGGGLSEAWPYAAVANHYLDGFPERFKQAVKTAEQLFEILKTNSHFQIEKIPNGTNIYKLKMINVDSRKFREALKGKSIELRSPSTEFNGFWLYINESINQLSAEKLAQLFIDTINEI
jgi:threonine aldolase